MYSVKQFVDNVLQRSGIAAPPTLVSAGAISKVLGNLPPQIIPIYSNFTSANWNLTDTIEPVAFEWNNRRYSRHELMLVISCSLTLLLGLIQLLMGT